MLQEVDMRSKRINVCLSCPMWPHIRVGGRGLPSGKQRCSDCVVTRLGHMVRAVEEGPWVGIGFGDGSPPAPDLAWRRFNSTLLGAYRSMVLMEVGQAPPLKWPEGGSR